MAATPWSRRRISRTAGVLYLLTFVSIPTLSLYGSGQGANYVIGPAPTPPAMVGGVLEIIVALAGIGTAVVLFPMLKKRTKDSRWAGRLPSPRSRHHLRRRRVPAVDRVLAGGMVPGQMPWSPPAMRSSRCTTASSSSGQSFIPAVDDLLFGLLLYQSRLVPRALSRLGSVAAPVLVAGYLAVLLGLTASTAHWRDYRPSRVALFEFSLGVWLVVKGFDPEAVAALEANDEPPDLAPQG